MTLTYIYLTWVYLQGRQIMSPVSIASQLTHLALMDEHLALEGRQLREKKLFTSQIRLSDKVHGQYARRQHLAR
jgi:hypothetical protein